PVPGGRAVAFDPAGSKRVAVADGARTVMQVASDRLSLKVDEVKSVIDPTVPGPYPAALAWSPDGERLAVPFHEPISGGYGIDVYDTTRGRAKPLTGHTGRVH